MTDFEDPIQGSAAANAAKGSLATSDVAVRAAQIEAQALGLSEKPESLGRQAWDRFRRHKLAIIGTITLIFLAVAFWIGPFFVSYDYDTVNIVDRAQGPSFDHPFGTDDLGRDLLARTLRGGQYSLRIAVFTAVLATLIGTFFGALAGYFGGLTDGLISFLVNVMLTLPGIIILIIFGREFGSRPNTVAVLIAFLSWLRASRLVRAQVLQLKEMEFVQAARAAGAGSQRIIMRHLVPNIVSILLVEITLLAGTAIILESTLSFLGLGVQPPDTTLGTLIAEGKSTLDVRPSRVLIPGAVVTAIILSINFIGDALRDAVDPKSGTD